MMEDTDNNCQNGTTATFVVKVLFRQNTSRRVSITWLEAENKLPFRSVLGMLLMESALNLCSTEANSYDEHI